MGLMKLLASVLVMMYVCHIFACGWYMVGDDDGDLKGWIHGQMGIWTITEGATDPCPVDPADATKKLCLPEHISLGTRYVASYLLWAI